MSKRTLTAEEIADVYEMGGDDESNYSERTRRRQAFFEWLATHDAEVLHRAALFLRGSENPRQSDNTVQAVRHSMDDAGYELLQLSKRVAIGAGVVAEETEWEYGWHTGSTVSLIGRRDQVEDWLAVRGWNPVEFTIASAEGRVFRLVRAGGAR
ncbi:hypothetical protein [uncultured Microbacterium sp.]|uniref:hypothetical protein n=1 Tax=uncultured Microbacterium sp. TaxID=191216 RepID=UPI0028E2BE24|nr:hypothetical protein [uncultured Microbacterium sp.]